MSQAALHVCLYAAPTFFEVYTNLGNQLKVLQKARLISVIYHFALNSEESLFLVTP